MWRDIEPELNDEIAALESKTRSWIDERLANRRLVGFVAKTLDGRVAGSGCLWIRDVQPRPTSSRLETPYLLSMYTEKEFRKKGVARKIVQFALTWCREQGYDRVLLHASEEGKPLYESLGFKPTSEMILKL
jgi:GNAT superfamily N-acetyltransferase